jgi:NAD(P)-dependent dehydrogenase (short-subunit alcohol dehydrogenase family)
MDCRWTGFWKKALVTGAAQGLGAAHARVLAREGARVLMTDINADKVAAAAQAINDEFGEGTARPCPRRDRPRRLGPGYCLRRRGARRAVGAGQQCGIGVRGTIETCTLEEWRRGFAVNVDSVFLGCQKALPLMKDNQPGSIINISSIAGLIVRHHARLQCQQGSGVDAEQVSRALLRETRLGDRCNSIHRPLSTRPFLTESAPMQASKEVIMGKLARQIPWPHRRARRNRQRRPLSCQRRIELHDRRRTQT